MQPLDLYASIEQYLDFEEEIKTLYNEIGTRIVDKDIKTVIDIGCGQGEFCRLLELNGFDVLGVDLSEKQIEIAQKKGINAQAVDIKYITEKFDCATAVFDVVNYLSYDYIDQFFKYVYPLLNDNGYFIFDVNSLHGFEDVAQGTLTIDSEEKFIAIDANFEDNILSTKIDLFTKVGEYFKKDNGTIKQYYYTNEKIKKIASKNGFEVVAIEGFSLHSDEYDKYIITLRKKG